ncbi:hypothetical protein Tco_0921145 [Tanacetum coccineum]
MRPFGCPVTILNTINHLGKFNGKADEGFFVGYSLNSKSFKVFNSRTRIVEENSHIRFHENTPNVVGSGPDWLFDIDALTRTINYKPIVVDDGSKPSSDDEKKVDEDPIKDGESIDQEKDDNVNNTNNVNAASINEVNAIGGKISIELLDDPNIPALEDIIIFDLLRDNKDVGAEADMNNLDTTIQLYLILLGKAKKNVRLMMEKLFRMELELMLVTQRQKVELDDEKEDLKGYLDIVPREDVAVDVDSLSTKYPIVDWKTYTLNYDTNNTGNTQDNQGNEERRDDLVLELSV